MPSAARRRMPAPAPLPPDVFVGHILNYDQGKGYGFIHCHEVVEGDIYFQRGHLPLEFQGCVKEQLKGQEVEVILHLTPDGKPRADKVRPTGPPPPTRGREPTPPRLSPAMVRDITRYLEERGGAMDYGKFARDFRGVKKSQLEDFFRLRPSDGEDGGGRWQITLRGAAPHPPAERSEREERQESGREPERQQEDTMLGRFAGRISLFDPTKGYGFIKSNEVAEGDVYFKRNMLPPDAQALPKPRLVGAEVEFDCWLTAQGKVRAESMELLQENDDEQAEPAGGQEARGDLDRSRLPVKPLEDATVDKMRNLLEDKGGAMDYGKFSNAFPGVKKQQLEAHFTLVMEGNEAGGRWQITLPGVEPLTTEEREAQEAAEGRAEREPRGRPPSQEPSEVMWLVGCVRRWDMKKNFGFLEVEGLDDVFLHRNDLPPDLQALRGGLQGAQLAFELAVNDEGRFRIKTARALLEPDGRGGWQLRRS